MTPQVWAFSPGKPCGKLYNIPLFCHEEEDHRRASNTQISSGPQYGLEGTVTIVNVAAWVSGQDDIEHGNYGDDMRITAFELPDESALGNPLPNDVASTTHDLPPCVCRVLQ